MRIFLGLMVLSPILTYFSLILVDEYRHEVRGITRGQLLKRAKNRNREIIELEFPLVVELFAILIGAGMSPSMALAHISEKGKGEFISLLRPIVNEMRRGMNLSQALDLLNADVDSAVVRRFCDSLAISVERGTPLIEVVGRQVEEVRQAHRSHLTERANKAEITLMIPVVFLILPISILFALWPSYFALGGGFGGIG
jgi:tight adherence protein C